MNEINKSFLNSVKNRFLPLPRSATEEIEHEPNISDFNIIKEIGNGSYGKVYLATHKKTKAKYAIKAIDKLNIENKQEKTYFNREVEIMYKLDHPNIVKLYSHFEDNKFCYLLVKYCPKGNAYDLLIKNWKKSNMELVASIMADIIRAVYYLHNMIPKIIHRDIKPENILLDENNRAYLTDFGWSNYIINGRRRKTICGTPIYQSPEMAKGIDYDERIDLWSIGILLFELSTGKTPFKGNDIETVRRNIGQTNITWPRNIDPDIKDLCSRILKTNPNQRPNIENILEHRFFKKYLKNKGNILIKPKKINNKIFVVSKDIPTEIKENKENKENYINKRYNSTERNNYKTLAPYQNLNLNWNLNNSNSKGNTDSKNYISLKTYNNNIPKSNHAIKDISHIKRKLIYSINNSEIEKNNNSVYISNNKRTNHIRNQINLYSRTLISFMKTEENKRINNKYNNKYPIYSNQIFNKTLIIKHSNSLDKNHNNVSLYKDKIISKNKNERIKCRNHNYIKISENKKDLNNKYKVFNSTSSDLQGILKKYYTFKNNYKINNHKIQQYSTIIQRNKI